MTPSRTVALSSAALLAVVGLTACSSTSSASPDVADLDARVTALESQVKGLEAIVGKVIIADPAAAMAEMESQITGLQKELNSSQAQAADVADAVAAEAAAAQAAAADAQKAIDNAKANANAAADVRDQAIADAQVKVAEARAALDALKAKIAEAIGGASPSPASPAPTASAQ